MKITAFDELYSVRLSTGDTIIGGSGGSNSALGDVSGGGDVVGNPGDYTVVGLRDTVSLASNIGGNTIGDVLTIIQTSPRLAMFAAPSNTAVGSNFLLRTLGGAGQVTPVPTSGTAKTLMVGGANYFEVTLTANCTIGFTGWPSSGSISEIGVRVTEDGTGGWTPTFPSVTWTGGTAPTHATTALTSVEYVFWSSDGGGTIYGGAIGGGPASPLTTKGDLYTYSTTNARLAVGSNGAGIIADSSQTVGIRWTMAALAGELLMADGVSNPPVPVESDPSGTDWLYSDL